MVHPMIAANWKMHKTIPEAVDFARALKAEFPETADRDIVLAPPYTALSAVAAVLKDSPIHLGAQNVHWEEKGAFTGEISAAMLADAGCRYVIVGHSERRTLFGETNETVNRKLRSVLDHNLLPILCIGETLEEREEERTFSVIEEQVKEALNNMSASDIRRFTFAYEPVWAIGTGKTATAGQAQEVHAFIRKLLGDAYGGESAAAIAILYGGSVKADNIASLMAEADINGALVGGASLDAAVFGSIVRYDRQ
ncbi:MAG: triose-phosphate isomerase [Deltaproteobacteria bacterium]|nr:triose-phosphate isomerase [Deltaproteobacteria bacterium]